MPEKFPETEIEIEKKSEWQKQPTLAQESREGQLVSRDLSFVIFVLTRKTVHLEIGGNDSGHILQIQGFFLKLLVYYKM